MPAIAIPGASVATHPTYFSMPHGGREQMVNVGSLQPSLSLSSSWPLVGADHYGNQYTDPYGLQPTSNWPLGGNNIPGVPYARQINQLPTVPNDNGWRTGDWMCTCGFHNYSSRVQCKKCNTPTPVQATSSLVSPAVTALGSKRVASDEFIHNWDNKRLNAGQAYGLQHPELESFQSPAGTTNSIYPAIHSGNTALAPNLQVNLQLPHIPATPTLLGKGAKQWRDGDWMCSNCNNHNYASRAQCNRCKSEREVLAQPVSVA
ncbi:hypothetical protein BUALT_Bualt04G0045300 [Buddleja alternifolia]|uniref:RanBP2-type domain-containing protein n=1 Tax=Buddleja alternifolia TaxID=168488 RepID=A0AAV6XWX7_9LAMI|nr:hypothetical protein BUALT_Bualt04G0045300 [Buddleja alternifolia]